MFKCLHLSSFIVCVFWIIIKSMLWYSGVHYSSIIDSISSMLFTKSNGNSVSSMDTGLGYDLKLAGSSLIDANDPMKIECA